MCLVNGLLDETRVRRVVQRVVAADRHDGPAIMSQFVRLLRLDLTGAPPRSKRHALGARHVASGPSSPGLTGVVTARELVTAFRTRPAIDRRLRIQVGCDVL